MKKNILWFFVLVLILGSTIFAISKKPITETVQKTSNIKNFMDYGKTFSFSYPKEFSVIGSDSLYTQDWSANTTDLGLVLAKVQIPKEYQLKTNFSEANFIVGTSSDTHAIKNCLTALNGEILQKEPVVINGTNFTKINISDAGAGNFYETTKYRTLKNDQCYSIEYTIHSMNIGNYSPDQGISEYDKAGIIKILESIITSFKFL